MIIYDSFYLSGFTRLDKGEAGAVFVRYSEEEEVPAPTVTPAYLRYGGAGTANYIISVPKLWVNACAIVTRTSKNCYRATVYDEKRIESFSESTLDSLRRTVAEFFGVDAASIASA